MSPISDLPRERAAVLNLTDLGAMNLPDLRAFASDAGLTGISSLKKQDLIFRLLQAQAEREGNIFASGILEIVEDGYGFLRQDRFRPGQNDIYVSLSQIRRFGLRTGDDVAGQVRPPKDAERYFGLLRVEAVNGADPDTARARPHFEETIPVYATEMLRMETGPSALVGRVIDLVAPIGKGHRGLIVGPPGTGKTTVLCEIAHAIGQNNPTVQVVMLLIGERPEEVTDIQRHVRGEVFYSTFDERREEHIRLAEMTLERGRRLVEEGRDAVILLDGVTRLLAAYGEGQNLYRDPDRARADSDAVQPVKRIFGAARKVERGGSLTLLGTFDLDENWATLRRVHEEFRSLCNVQITLTHADQQGASPVIDMSRSATRREELLLSPETLKGMHTLRQMLGAVGSQGSTELLLARMSRFHDNAAFLGSLIEDVA